MKRDHTIAALRSKHDHSHSPARRSFVLGSLGILALARFEYALPQLQGHEPLSSIEDLLSAIGNRSHARKIGRIFLSSDAGRNFDRDRSLRRLSSDLRPFECVSEHIKERIHSDFLESDTVRLEGWVLSRTEVELCALSLT